MSDFLKAGSVELPAPSVMSVNGELIWYRSDFVREDDRGSGSGKDNRKSAMVCFE